MTFEKNKQTKSKQTNKQKPSWDSIRDTAPLTKISIVLHAISKLSIFFFFFFWQMVQGIQK